MCRPWYVPSRTPINHNLLTKFLEKNIHRTEIIWWKKWDQRRCFLTVIRENKFLCILNFFKNPSGAFNSIIRVVWFTLLSPGGKRFLNIFLNVRPEVFHLFEWIWWILEKARLESLFCLLQNYLTIMGLKQSYLKTRLYHNHGDIILSRSNNSYISIETSAP